MWGAWLPVIGYLALIFTLSSIPHLAPPATVDNSDKIAHFLEYGFLGLLLFRGLRHSWNPGRLRNLFLALLIGGGVAALDEVYQGTVGRDRSFGDWTADMAGLAVGNYALGLLLEKRRTARARSDTRAKPSKGRLS